jgi:hypothetical protein
MKNLRLFERESNDLKYILYKMKVEPKLNINTLTSMTRLRIKPFFNIYDQKEFLRYRFELLKQ